MISEHCDAAAAASAATVTPSPETVIHLTRPRFRPRLATQRLRQHLLCLPTRQRLRPRPALHQQPRSIATPHTRCGRAAPATASPSAPSAPPVEVTHRLRRQLPLLQLSAHHVVEAAGSPATFSPCSQSRSRPNPSHQNGSHASPTQQPTLPLRTPQRRLRPATAEPASVPLPPHPMHPRPWLVHRAGSLTLLIFFVVLVIVLGTTAPLIGRWRKRKALERDGNPRSFLHE